MPEFTLQDLRRLYMINALYPKESWEFKKVAYDNSADEYGDQHRSVTSLKSYWNLHRQLWGRIHLLNNPPVAIPNDVSDTHGQEHQPNNSGTQDLEGYDFERTMNPKQRNDIDPSLPGAPNQGLQYNTSLGEHSDSFIGQHQVYQTAPTFNSPMSYVDQALLRFQGQQDQPNVSMDKISTDYSYNPYPLSPYPLHSASANHGQFFSDTTYAQPHFASPSSGWNASYTGNLHGAAEQHPMGMYSMGMAPYSSAGSNPNTYVACNPSNTLAPQITHLQTNKPGHLTQIPEQNLPDDDVDAQERVTYVGSSEGEMDSGSEGQS